MRLPKTVALIITVLFVHCLVGDRPARGGIAPALISLDAIQEGPGPEDNFETVLSGNQTSQLTGQFLNAFTAPNSVSVSYSPATNSTTIEFAGQPIASNPSTYQTFGFAINASSFAGGVQTVNPANQDGYWTLGQTIDAHVPDPSFMAQYTPASHQATITISNDPGTFSLSGVGYLVTSAPFALSSLDRTTLPPSAFLPSGVADGTTLTPGESASFMISGIDPGQYVTIFADAQFSGASSGNPYTDVSGRWFEFQAAVPEPASWVLMMIGTTTLLFGARCRSGGRLLRLKYSPPRQ